MSDASEINELDGLSPERSYGEYSDEEADSRDTRHHQYSSDEDEEEEDDADMQNDGFVVDDDEPDEEEERRRRRREKRKKKRRLLEQEAEQDMLDDEDLALVAENTYGEVKAPRLKRLKRGRARRAMDDDELQAELDDLTGTGANEAEADEFATRPVRHDDLGLFDNEMDELDQDDFRAARRAERMGHADTSTEYADELDEGPRVHPGAERTGAMASFLSEGLDAIDDDTWLELQEIFGTGEEYAFAMEPPIDQDAMGVKALEDVFEPAELEAKMMTQRDEEIRTTDIPERMQMRAASSDMLRPLSEEEIEEETTWVMRQLNVRLARQEAQREHRREKDTDDDVFKQADFANEQFVAAVLSVLKLLSQDFFEVPFIVKHRREVFVTTESVDPGSVEEPPTHEWLTEDDIWQLYDYDLQFRGFLSARRSVQNTVRRLCGEGADSERVISADDELYASQMLSTAETVENISDVSEWLHARYASVIQKWTQSQAGPKRARNVGLWEQARRNGTEEFAKRFGITAQQIGDNIRDPDRHAVDADAEPPEEAARRLVGTELASPELALRAAKATYAHMIALDPQIRRFVRQFCVDNAGVIVRPTERGLREITHEEHPAFAFKFLKQKPVTAFVGAQFMELQRAVNEGLLRMQFSVSGKYRFSSKDMSRDDAVFTADRDESARLVAMQLSVAGSDLWESARSEAVTAAMRDHVLPQIWRETAQRLQQQASEYVAAACQREIEQRINMAPPRTERMRPEEQPRIAVVGSGFAASARGTLRIVVVDEHGDVTETHAADSLRDGSNGAATLLAILARQAADIVAVSGLAMATRRVHDDVRTVVDSHCARSGDDVMVTYANDEAARVWWDSAAACAELPSLGREERYCVAVARTLQDAPAVYAGLGRDVLQLALHPAQRNVENTVLMAAVERALVNVINRVGVDINGLALHAHKRAVLAYVSGLGPRKAHAILSGITPDHLLESRSDLVTQRLCTRTVFVNCVSFLRVHPSVVDVLDGTRIHPEDYDLARKMAVDALDIEDDDADDPRAKRKRDKPSRYVSEVMRRSPERLDELDLVKYADELKKIMHVYKLGTLKFIKHELQNPHADPRPSFEPPSPEQVLQMLTGERVGETLREDGLTMVSATVVRVQPRFAIARLDSGLEGFIGVANIADYRVEEASDELSPGQMVAAVVKRIDLDRMSLDLSLRRSDIDAACASNREPVPDSSHVDPFFDLDTETALRERARAQQRQSTARLRTVPHPLFKPLSGREAEQYLAARPRGDCVIRPSSRGPDHIAITWKVGDGLFQHIDVREENKPHAAALGLSFTVGDLSYSDLDELIALHVDPIARRLDEVRRSPKFYDPESDPLYASEPLADVLGANDYSAEYRERRLALWEKRVARHLDTLAQSTGRGAYCVSLSLAKPGALVLAFKPTPTHRGIIKWTARVEPNEFKLGERGRYPDIAGLINGFKMMQTKPQQSSRSSASRSSQGANPPSGSSSDGRSGGRGGRWGGTSSWGAQQQPSSAQWGSAGSGWN
ncbi:Transcription elongation factor spt6 [Coemansia sp. RSA 1290]|nr:Transcription elongation factor spt6 [Coemansia sp. RSA 1290]KAJ2651480.1 Transcription elongation factor spt6 [Coemansia sp. RSA 1250]